MATAWGGLPSQPNATPLRRSREPCLMDALLAEANDVLFTGADKQCP